MTKIAASCAQKRCISLPFLVFLNLNGLDSQYGVVINS